MVDLYSRNLMDYTRAATRQAGDSEEMINSGYSTNDRGVLYCSSNIDRVKNAYQKSL